MACGAAPIKDSDEMLLFLSKVLVRCLALKDELTLIR